MRRPTQDQLNELKRLSKEARVPDMSETVTTSEEAENRIRDLKEKARMEWSTQKHEPPFVALTRVSTLQGSALELIFKQVAQIE
jgi:hypothetical protein